MADLQDSECSTAGAELSVESIAGRLDSIDTTLRRLDALDLILGRLDSIDTTLQSISGRVEAVEAKQTSMDRELASHGSRHEEAEERISTLEDELQSALKSIKEGKAANLLLSKSIDSLQSRADLQEDRGRRKNLILFNLPEEAVGDRLLPAFIQQRLATWLRLPTDRVMELERVHRSLQERPAAGKPPRPVFIRFLRFTNVICHAGREGCKLAG